MSLSNVSGALETLLDQAMLTPRTLQVLVKIEATRNTNASPVEDVVRNNVKERRDKLLRISLAYDLAHAKGEIKETEEEKKGRKKAEAAKKAKEKKAMREKLEKEKKKRYVFLHFPLPFSPAPRYWLPAVICIRRINVPH
jgi:hypothetical protein